MRYNNRVRPVEKRCLAYLKNREKAKTEAQKAVDALAILPESEYKQALISLAWLSVDRAY